jgi:hypothetical protein
MTYRSMSDCVALGLPGYDEWKTRSPDDEREDEPEDYDPEDYYEGCELDSLDEVFCFFDAHEPVTP